MTEEEFSRIVAQDPALLVPIKEAAAAVPTRQYIVGGGIGEAAALLVMYRVTKYVLMEIGLPWIYEGKRYSDFWRLKLRRRIDAEYRQEQLDPDQAEVASSALVDQLEKITDPNEQAAWERLATAMGATPQDGGSIAEAGKLGS